MHYEEDLSLIQDCLDRLEREGFRSDVLEPFDRHAIRQAAFRLAGTRIHREPGDLVHPLGFGRVPLTPWDLDRPRAAVHIWDRNAASTASRDVHDHCYDFVSVCCAGGLEHRIFRLEPSSGASLGTQALLYSAGSCDTAGSDTVEAEFGLAEIDCFVVEAPLIYEIGSDILHSARPTGKLTVTVQFQSPIVKPQARVYRPNAIEIEQPRCAPTAFTTERILRALRECL